MLSLSIDSNHQNIVLLVLAILSFVTVYICNQSNAEYSSYYRVTTNSFDVLKQKTRWDHSLAR